MTEAEKAAKAAADAKAAAEKKASEKPAEKPEGDDEKPDDDEPEKPPAKNEGVSRAEFEAFKKTANKEAEKHRLRAKQAEDALEQFRSSMAGALGLKPGDSAPKVDEAAAKQTAKARNLLLRAEFTSLAAAAGAISPGDAFALAAPMLKGVDVDLDAETVDTDALAETIEALKVSKPFLFGSKSAQNGGTEAPEGAKPPGKMPDGNGAPAKGGTAYQQWQALEKAGRRNDAATFYAANRQKIRDSWPAS